MSAGLLVSAQVLISGSQVQAPHWAPCWPSLEGEKSQLLLCLKLKEKLSGIREAIDLARDVPPHSHGKEPCGLVGHRRCLPTQASVSNGLKIVVIKRRALGRAEQSVSEGRA